MTAQQPLFAPRELYAVSETVNERTHYIAVMPPLRYDAGWGRRRAICGRDPLWRWTWRSRGEICNACHAAACSTPSIVRWKHLRGGRS